MTTDDFENPDSSPLPPYDRDWRHPAEVADTERARHLGASPPLGRRLTALTVIASALTSLVVLTVAIPKGIEGYTQDDEEEVSPTSTVMPVKGSAKASIAVLRGAHGSTSALSLGNSTWLVSSEAIRAKSTSTAYEEPFTVLRENKELGLSVIRVDSAKEIPAVNFERIDDELALDELPDCRIVDAFQVHTVASEPSLVLQSYDDYHPINMTTSVKGLAIVVNNQQDVVGVVVRAAHAHRMVSKKALLKLTAR